MNRRRVDHGSHASEQGSVLVFVAMFLVAVCAMAALAIDVGWLYLTRTELQSAADAAALAAAAQLVDEDIMSGGADLSDDIVSARDSAEEFALLNVAAQTHLEVDRNDANLLDGGIVVGRLADPMDLNQSLDTSDLQQANSVSVVCERSAAQNSPVPLFFANVGGSSQASVRARATATLDNRVIGFAHQSGSENVYPILPFALEQEYFTAQFTGSQDDWAYDESSSSFALGPDGVPEIKMYPYRMKDDPTHENPAGNFGSVDIGPDNNSTADLERQILIGVSGDDLDVIGGLSLHESGGDWYQDLNGDTGVSVAIKDELQASIGEGRVLPLFSTLTSPGNNATYRIVSFVPVRIADVRLTGNPDQRHILVQPFQATFRNAVTHASAPANSFVSQLTLTR